MGGIIAMEESVNISSPYRWHVEAHASVFWLWL